MIVNKKECFVRIEVYRGFVWFWLGIVIIGNIGNEERSGLDWIGLDFGGDGKGVWEFSISCFC